MVAPSTRQRRPKMVVISSSATTRTTLPCPESPSPPALSALKALQLQPLQKTLFCKRVEVLAIMLIPPLLTSFLLKSAGLLTGGVVLFRGISNLSSENRLSPVVQTLDGPVQGRLDVSRGGHQFWSYLSIPYAQPPTRSLRFQPPAPVQPWKDVKQGLKYPPACIQFEPVALGKTWGVEDCLFLNVFVPKHQEARRIAQKKSESLPVLVYIHGGAFLEGQSSFYQPDYLMDHNMIVVTFNYRLGPLGFLNFHEKNDTTGFFPRGNMGLKDQNMVLRWIQNNIAMFGGDPNQVTLMADSAGAVSLNLHMLSPMSRGLFHRAIAISGSSLCPWGFTQIPRKIAFSYGARLGCPTGDSHSLLNCYMNMDASQLVKHQYAWSDPLHEKDEFVPSIEILPNFEAFLMEAPMDIISKGDIAKIPLLTGVTSGEGGLRSGRFRANPDLIPIVDENWNKAVDKVLFLDEPLAPEVAQDLKSYYFGNNVFSKNIGQFFEGMTKLATDALFVGPTLRVAAEHARNGNPTYVFYYDYKSALMPATFSAFSLTSISDSFVGRWSKLICGLAIDWIQEFLLGAKGTHAYGIGHAEDLFQIWNINGVLKWLTLVDINFSNSLVQCIADFTSNTKPLTFRGLAWPQVEPDAGVQGLKFMKMDNTGIPKVTSKPFGERMQFWDRLRSKYALRL